MAVKRSRPTTPPPDFRLGKPVEQSSVLAPSPEAPKATQTLSAAPATPRRRPHLPPIPEPTTGVNVKLPTEDHRELRRVADDLADQLGLSHVPIAHVLAALAAHVSTDNDLRSAIADRLRPRIEQP